MAARYTLSAGERLKREQHIKALFQSGKALSVFPLRLIWRLVDAEEASSTCAGFSAPKKKFGHAKDRNRIKRLMREAWRLQKPALLPAIPAGKQLHLFILFTDKSLPDYPTVFAAIGKGITQLQKALADVQPAS
jgi:ribonuclease P protein component